MSVTVTYSQEQEKYSDKDIELLSKKAFKYTSIKGKEALSLITNYSGDIWEQKWYLEGYGKSCENNIAKLNRPGSAISIPDSSLILAFLDCPASNDGGADSIIAIFNKDDTDNPLCFKRIVIMGNESDFFWGSVRSLNIKKASKFSYYVIATLSGADAEDAWTNIVFLHIDSKCQVTVLSKFYESISYNFSTPNKFCGKNIEAQFINNHIVEVVIKKGSCSENNDNIYVSNKRYNLDELLQNQTKRVYEPKTK